MPDVFDLYPKPQAPPQQSSTALGPLQMLDVMGRINALQQFQSRQAVGEEAQRAIHGGAFNPSEYRSGISRRPDAALAAPEAIGHSLDLDQKNISNATALFEQFAMQNNYAQAQLQGLANIKDPKPDDAIRAAVNISREADARGVPSSVLNAVLSSVLNNPRGIAAGAKELQNRVMGAAATAQRITGPRGLGGEETTIPLGSAPSGMMPIGQPPGEAERQVGAAEAARAIESTGPLTAQYHADLDNLKQLSKVIEIGGPTVELEKKLGQFASRFGLPSTVTPEQLKGVEEFDKIANQISLNQSKLFHGSDAGLHTVVGANPSTSMSRYGREGVIDMLHGNQDAIDVTRKMWLAAQRKGAPANSYHQFVDKLSETLDPRVFQFNRLNRENQQKFLSQIDPADLGDFERKYQEAIDRKWVNPLKKAAP